MKKFILGALFVIFFQFILISLIILYKGEKSYYTYYAFLSKIPDNYTEVYLKSAIKSSQVEEAINLLRRQKKLIYSNSNEIMISDLLINTYSVYNIVNSNDEKKLFLLWLDDLNNFIKKGYGDYYLDYIYSQIEFDLSSDDEQKKIFNEIQKLNFSNPNIYKKPLTYYFLQNKKIEIEDLCEQYIRSDTIYLPNVSKYHLNNQKFREFNDKIKIILNDDQNNSLLSKIYLNRNEEIIIDNRNFKSNKDISKISIDTFFQPGVIFRIKDIKYIYEGDEFNQYDNYILNAKNGLFYNDKSYIGLDTLNRDLIDIHFKKKIVKNYDQIILNVSISKLNPTSINCND